MSIRKKGVIVPRKGTTMIRCKCCRLGLNGSYEKVNQYEGDCIPCPYCERYSDGSDYKTDSECQANFCDLERFRGHNNCRLLKFPRGELYFGKKG